MEYIFRKNPVYSFILLVVVIYFLPNLFGTIPNSEMANQVIFGIVGFGIILYAIYVLEKNDIFKIYKGLFNYLSIIVLCLIDYIVIQKDLGILLLFKNYLIGIAYYLIILNIFLFIRQSRLEKVSKLKVKEIKERTKLKR